MPPKRGKRSKTKQKRAITTRVMKISRTKFKKRAITTRLMEISLKLDDYVYNKKPIPIADAQAYIDEISMYKIQCLKDERSLQVVEKLTRCMKSIVDEEQNNYASEEQRNTRTKVTAYYCPSPTYSLVEEDIAPIASNQDIQDTQITKLKAVESNSELTIIGTIDLCVEENVKNYTEFNIDVEMHRAISNLSLRDEDPLNTTDIFSQSILHNFEQLNPGSSNHTIENSQIVLHPNLDFTISTATTPYYEDNFIKDHIINPKCNNNEIYLIGSQNIPELTDSTEDENPCQKEVNAKKVVRFEKNINKEAIDDVVAKKHNKNDMKKHTQKRNISKEKFKNQVNTTTKGKPKRQVNKQKKSNKQINVTCKDTKVPRTKAALNGSKANGTVSTKIDTVKTSCGTNYDRMSINDNAQKVIPISNNVQTAKKQCVSFYPTNTENDLSWVEKIRFVREIEKEEIDVKLSSLDETFWEDLSFPNDWDEHYFNV